MTMVDDNAAAYLHFSLLEDAEGRPTQDKIASLVLNRPAAANAFSGDLLVELKTLLDRVAADRTIRLLLVQGAGRHFSAGADLHWMQEAAKLDFKGNLAEAEKLTRMFEALANLSIPTLAIVKGAAFGGAVGLVAACDYAFAFDQARFCLSETKIGLLPAVILPYLARKIPTGHLHRQVLSARVFSAQEAVQLGLVQAVLSNDRMEEALREEINLLLAASPEAQGVYKRLHGDLAALQWRQDPLTAKAIAETRASPMGLAGLGAFFQKTSPPWAYRLPAQAQVLLPVTS